MNDAHLHLLVNHLPIVSCILGTLILLVGLVLKNRTVKLTAIGVLILTALFSVVAFLTGEGAEEIVEESLDISHKLIHEHEEHAELFHVLNLILGVVALITVWLEAKSKAIAKYAYILVLVLSVVAMYFGAKTGTSGGEIRHTEIRES